MNEGSINGHGLRLWVAASRRLRNRELARFMGTSVEQIDKTYGHLLPDAPDRTRSAPNAFLADSEAACAAI